FTVTRTPSADRARVFDALTVPAQFAVRFGPSAIDYGDAERLAECAGADGPTDRLAAHCGPRRAGLAALEREHTDLAGRLIHVRKTVSGRGSDLPKNGEERTVAYPAFLHAELSRAGLAAGGCSHSAGRNRRRAGGKQLGRRPG